LRYWDDTGKLVAVRTPGGHRRYRLSTIEKFQGLDVYAENEDATAESEFVDDILALMDSFSAKLYGRRSAERRRKKKTDGDN